MCGARACSLCSYHEALGGKYVPRAVLFDMEPGVIGAVALSRRSANSSARLASLVNKNSSTVNNWAKARYTKAGRDFC